LIRTTEEVETDTYWYYYVAMILRATLEPLNPWTGRLDLRLESIEIARSKWSRNETNWERTI